MKIAVVILAGGQGTRFWPVSRAAYPKQFLKLSNSDDSLIQAVEKRMRKLVDEDPYVITGNGYTELVKEHLPNAKVIYEPCGKNTAPAIGLAALHIKRKEPDAIMVVCPSDHVAQKEDILIETLRLACKVADEKKLLLTIGIQPDSPNTGYGYIKLGASISDNVAYVKRFYEKPNLQRAVKYLEDGGYYWNSGMFAWKASVVLDSIKKHMPDLYEGLMKIDASIGTASEAQVTSDVFSNLESQSIDFGVLEHSKDCAVVTAEPFGWSDVGSWDAWAELFPKDEQKNLMVGNGLILDSNDCIVRTDGKFVAVLGCKNLVLIENNGVILACDKSKLQDIKKIVAWLEKKGIKDLI